MFLMSLQEFNIGDPVTDITEMREGYVENVFNNSIRVSFGVERSIIYNLHNEFKTIYKGHNLSIIQNDQFNINSKNMKTIIKKEIPIEYHKYIDQFVKELIIDVTDIKDNLEIKSIEDLEFVQIAYKQILDLIKKLEG